MKFICPPIEKIKYMRDLENHPINLEHVILIEKSNYKWYPDNVGIPAIYFKINNGDEKVAWVFNTEKDRDSTYKLITDNFFYKIALFKEKE